MKTYRIQWVDRTEYETDIEANSAEEALRKFHDDGPQAMEPTGWVEFEEDSISVWERQLREDKNIDRIS